MNDLVNGNTNIDTFTTLAGVDRNTENSGTDSD